MRSSPPAEKIRNLAGRVATLKPPETRNLMSEEEQKESEACVAALDWPRMSTSLPRWHSTPRKRSFF